MKLKILHVIDHLAVGGGQMSVKGIVERSDPETAEHLVCALRQPTTECVEIRGRVFVLPYAKWDVRVVRAIRTLCRENDIHIVHTHLQRSTICSLLAMGRSDIPVIVHERGALSRRGLVFSLYRLLLRCLHRRARLYIANSRTIADRLQRVGIAPERIQVVYNAIDFEMMERDLPDRTSARRFLGIAEGQTVIGYLGRLHPIKGVDLLIQAFAHVASQRAQAVLILIGDGPQRGELQALVDRLHLTEHVRFLGMREQVHTLMPAFDIGVVPSRYESFGRVQIELMRMHVPVVSSGKGGLSEHIVHEVTGLVALHNTPEQLAAAIERYLQDASLRQGVIDRAYAATAAFSMTAQVRRLYTIYHAIGRDVT